MHGLGSGRRRRRRRLACHGPEGLPPEALVSLCFPGGLAWLLSLCLNNGHSGGMAKEEMVEGLLREFIGTVGAPQAGGELRAGEMTLVQRASRGQCWKNLNGKKMGWKKEKGQ